jgi:hypothetical protein
LGSLLGTTLCGIAPGVRIMRVKPLKLAAIKEVKEELYEEALPQIRNLINVTIRVGITKTFVEVYKNSQKILKSFSSTVRKISLIGETIASWLDKWGSPDAKPWSINSGVKSVIKTIFDEKFREFYEETWEEFLESCQQALFVFSTAFG